MWSSGDWKAITPYHSYMAVLRSIEWGVPLFRQVGHGLSISTNALGQILDQLNYFQAEETSWVLSLPLGGVRAIYMFIGDCIVFVGMFFCFRYFL